LRDGYFAPEIKVVPLRLRPN